VKLTDLQPFPFIENDTKVKRCKICKEQFNARREKRNGVLWFIYWFFPFYLNECDECFRKRMRR
jgi:hypothetical protein